MSELYDWSKEKPFKVITNKLIREERSVDVRIIETGDHQRIIVKGPTTAESLKRRAARECAAVKPKFNLVGGIRMALQNALKEIITPKYLITASGIVVYPDNKGRLYFVSEGQRFYISADETMCLDSEGRVWDLHISPQNLYFTESEDPSLFEYGFINEQKEFAYLDRQEEIGIPEEGYEELFKINPFEEPSNPNVIDFVEYKKSLEGEQPKGR